MNNLNVQHDIINHLFYIKVKGGTAVLNYDQIDEKHLDYISTHVPEASQGLGVGKHLVEAALDYAKERDMIVKPTCPFVKHVIEHSDAYEQIVD
ncbi:N-acetyltransferase [Fulvivirga maritima]|uniref:GNAT family N-acetyltransferase n=1 Tax=Fulvivirga maritima TaxID=2904247 RepID=UPI001F1E0C04|nr:GNAT family N-acetyltransferase [Fulvivirga maritima]UII25019.1 N-acetyltransferase [Fulvivirga maritima]